PLAIVPLLDATLRFPCSVHPALPPLFEIAGPLRRLSPVPKAYAQFYLGHTLLAQEKAAEAAQQFQKVAAMQDVRYTESAEWHQVVAQLQADDTGNAFNSLLTKIASDESHAFNGQAKALQTKINSFWRKLVK
ncbi:MAG: hypothetical protein AAF960_23090, partial [Bacteroidota bacterium]